VIEAYLGQNHAAVHAPAAVAATGEEE
jgi:hypothetical protein